MTSTSDLAEFLLETAPDHEGWSLVESQNAVGRYEELLQWAREMTIEQWFADINVRRHKVGLVLLWLESEVARRRCKDGCLWPTLSNQTEVPWNKDIHAELFSEGGHATQGHRILLKYAATYFSLRHTFHEKDAQNWYRLIYLQFGFTHDDAVVRLSTWLSGHGQPVSVQLLLAQSDTGAKAFQKLWSSLRLFRLGNLSGDILKVRLKENPWVLPVWTGDLMAAAMKSRAQIPALADLEAVETAFFTLPKLGFRIDELPFFATSLCNLAELGLEANTYQFRAGNQVLARLIRQPDGSYHSDAGEVILLPMLPSVALSLVDDIGNISAYGVVNLWDMDEEVALYSTRTGLMIPPGERLLVGSAACAIAAEDVTLRPAPEASFELPLGFRLHRITRGWKGQIEAVIDDDVIWSSRATEGAQMKGMVGVSAEFTETLDLSRPPWSQQEGPWNLPIRFRFPVGWKFSRFRWRRSDGFLVELGSLPTHLTLTEADALRPLLLKIRITDGIVMRTEVLRIRAPFIAVLKWDQNGVPRRHTQVRNLLLSEARQMTWSFCLPNHTTPGDGEKGFNFAEGNHLLDAVKTRPAILPILAGYGAPLRIYDDPYQNDEAALTVADCVLDGGVLGSVKWDFEREGFQIRSRFLDVGDDHQFHGWISQNGSPSVVEEIPFGTMEAGENGWFWKPADGTRLHGAAVTFRGTCLGSWFDHSNWTSTMEQYGLSTVAETAAMLRAWKAPVLKMEGSHVDRVANWLTENWVEILPVWMADGPVAFSNGRKWQMPSNKGTWAAVLGELLCDAKIVPNTDTVGEFVDALQPKLKGVPAIGSAMWKIADCCPAFAARVVKIYLDEFVTGPDRIAFFNQALALPGFSNSDERAEELGIIHGRRDGYWLRQTVPSFAAIQTRGRHALGRSYRLLAKSSDYRHYALGHWLREIQ